MLQTALFTTPYDFCSLSFDYQPEQTIIDMALTIPHVTTATMPQTFLFLEKFAPTVLLTTCHNDLDLSFAEEVKDTELGHLFEHLVLDHLARHDRSDSVMPRIYTGTTDWNWYINPRGTFSITLSVGENEKHRLSEAIDWACAILERIIFSTNTNTETVQSASV